MAFTVQPLFPGMLQDAAVRLAADLAGKQRAAGGDPIGEMGWPALLVADEYGGVGGSLADLASILEGLAPQALQLPVIERCGTVPAMLQAAVVGERSAPWLRALADGTASIRALFPPCEDPAAAGLAATAQAGAYRLSGAVRGVHAWEGATHALAIANVSGKPTLFLIPADALPPPARRSISMDWWDTADFELRGLEIKADACIATGDVAGSAIAQGTHLALAATCVDMMATLGSLVEQTAEHLNSRMQFGVALSTFQVLRHRLVDVYTRYESARGMMAHLVRSAGAGAPDFARQARLFKVALGETARFAAEAAIQMHGGMGMSQETLAARLAQHLLASEFRWGDRFSQASALLAGRAEARP